MSGVLQVRELETMRAAGFRAHVDALQAAIEPLSVDLPLDLGRCGLG